MFCKNCGSQIPENSAFCVNCGAEAPDPVVVPVIQPDQGTSNQETMVFTPVPEAAAQQFQGQQTQQFQPVQQYQQHQQYQSQQPYQSQQYQQQYAPQPYPTPAPAPAPTTAEIVSSPASSESKNRTVIIVVIAVVLLAIIGVVLALFLTGTFGGDDSSSGSSKKNKGSEETTTGSEEVRPEDLSLDESNLYYEDYIDSVSYVLSATDSRYYSRAELTGMTRQQLYLAEREIFARYGCTFDDGDLSEYFSAKAWYSPDSPVGNFNESRLTPTERVNVLLLRALLMERDGTTSNNEYMKINNDTEGWILASTDSTRITKDDVKGLSETELIIAANEIYARNGYIFDDDKLQTYFSSKNWYVPSTPSGSFNAANMSEIEQENYTCLQECAAKIKGVKMTSDNRYEPYYYPYSEYILPESDKRDIDPYELEYLSAEELVLARNEIYARYGYSFNHAKLREYFMQCSWYYPTVVPEKLELIHLSKTELANVKMIQAFELELKLREGEGNPNTDMTYYAKHDWLTMYLPEHWRDNCICIKPNGTSGSMYFYEKYNEEKGYGFLFSIEFAPMDSDLDGYYGNYEIYGYLTAPDGSEYYVLKGKPYSDDTVYLEYLYDLMQSQEEQIWDSIKWASGYTFTKA